ncbi:hypothetical protein F5B17DRAFT_413080 [Nemania serpens]|nr:hypothetical protein F5B17DRAFT_413080 [Nemania serpens]
MLTCHMGKALLHSAFAQFSYSHFLCADSEAKAKLGRSSIPTTGIIMQEVPRARMNDRCLTSEHPLTAVSTVLLIIHEY